MRYVNAKDVLPPEVLAQVQQYSCGALIYIPKAGEERTGWGQQNGARAQVAVRNRRIKDAYRGGVPVKQLTVQFCLSEASIRKIIYNAEKVPLDASV